MYNTPHTNNLTSGSKPTASPCDAVGDSRLRTEKRGNSAFKLHKAVDAKPILAPCTFLVDQIRAQRFDQVSSLMKLESTFKQIADSPSNASQSESSRVQKLKLDPMLKKLLVMRDVFREPSLKFNQLLRDFTVSTAQIDRSVITFVLDSLQQKKSAKRGKKTCARATSSKDIEESRPLPSDNSNTECFESTDSMQDEFLNKRCNPSNSINDSVCRDFDAQGTAQAGLPRREAPSDGD